MLGTVANRSFNDLVCTAPFLAVGLAILFTGRRSLSALALGDEAAAGIGVDIPHIRRLVVVGAGLATGAAVAVAGVIGFVGIVAPHIVRPWVRHNPARTLAPSALLAGLLLIIADIGVRLAPTGTELKLGVVAALLGAPVFVWIVVRKRRPSD
jgi:iron complex transport system permease protein